MIKQLSMIYQWRFKFYVVKTLNFDLSIRWKFHDGKLDFIVIVYVFLIISLILMLDGVYCSLLWHVLINSNFKLRRQLQWNLIRSYPSYKVVYSFIIVPFGSKPKLVYHFGTILKTMNTLQNGFWMLYLLN